MVLILLGAALLFAGVVYMAIQPMHRRMSGGQLHSAATADKTLEPPKPASGFGLTANWPGLTMAALGGLLMLAAAAAS